MSYLIDLAIFTIPALGAVMWLLPAGFAPEAGPGLVALAGIALIGIIYGLVLAGMLARTGQSIGDRFLGLRVLTEDASQPSSVGRTLYRGLASLGGLLLIGIGPVIFWLEFRKDRDDQQTWLHQLSETTVIDIRSGIDPMNPVPAYYSPRVQDWIAPGTAATIEMFPPPLPVWSTQITSPPTQTSASVTAALPALPGTSTPQRRQAPRWIAPSIQGLTSIMVITALCFGSAWGSGFLQPLERPTGPHQYSAANLALIKPTLTTHMGAGFPGYASGPLWRKPLGTTAQVTSAQGGTFVFDNHQLTILDNATGTVISEQTLDDDVVFAQETRISGEPGMVWRISNTLHAWVPSLGKAPATPVDIPADATLSTAGTDLLVTAHDGKLSTLTKTGLAPVTGIDGKIAMGVDDGKLLSAKYSGSLTISSADGKDRQDVPLSAPSENLQFMKWVTAGHGLAVVLWSAFPDSRDPKNPVTIAVYRESTGELLSSLEVPLSRVDEDPVWVRGNGFLWASFAGYAYNLSSGLPLLDLKAQGIKRSGILADGVLGTTDEGPVYLQEHQATLYNGVTPLAIVASGAVVKTKDNEIQLFAAH